MFGKIVATPIMVLGLTLGLTGTGLAQTPSQISQFNAWGAYSYQQGKGKVCYVLSVPVDKKPANIDHGDNFFMVSQKPGQNVSYEPQFKAGYDLQENSKVLVKIDDRTFSMFTSGSHGWMENAAEEPQLVAALRSGHNMTINAVSKRGTKTSYAYSLKGVSAALKGIATCK